MKNPLSWFEIYVEDLERARRFYEEVFSTTLSELTVPIEGDEEEGIRMLAFPMEEKGEGAAGALVKMQGMTAGGNSAVVYFNSDDCSVEEGRITSAGGKVLQPKQSIGEFGFMVMAIDTEGNVFGIHSRA